MDIIKNYIVLNDCYNTDRKIVPSGIMIHSTATPGIMAKDFAARWNRPGLEKASHFFVDNKEVYQILPCEPGNVHRAWHCGKGKNGSGNDTMISMEICESKEMDDKVYFEAAYKNAVQLAAGLCHTFDILPDNVICHAEGYQKGIASNHSDVLHWFPRHGRDMEDFRKDVSRNLLQMEQKEKESATNVQSEESEDIIYRVQVGAFRKKENAKRLENQLEKEGYEAWITE